VTPGVPSAAEIIPTSLLADVLKPHIDNIARTLQRDVAFDVIARRVAQILGVVDVETVIRRVDRIYNERTRTTTLEIADALLCAVGSELTLENLPVLPNGIKAARLMVATYDETAVENGAQALGVVEGEKLARSLTHFSSGFLRGLLVEDPAPGQIVPAEAA
jgi:hypothetical protein